MQTRGKRAFLREIAPKHIRRRTISVNFKMPQTLVAVRTAGCCEWHWRRKAPMLFSCPDFGAPKIGPKPRSTCQGAILTLPRSHEATQRPTRADTGHLLLGISAGMYRRRKKRAAPTGTTLQIEYSVSHLQHRRSVLLLLHQKFQAVIQNLLLALGQHGQIEFTLDRQ